MKKILFGLIGCLVVVFTLVSVQSVVAQSFGQTQTEETPDVPFVVQDEGTRMIISLQEEPNPPWQPKNAEEQADEYLLNKEIQRGWDPRRETYTTVGVAFFDSENPSYDDSFITKRSLKTMEATLQAKANIIEYIGVTMTAFDKATTPGTDLHAQFRVQIERLERMMRGRQEEMAQLLAEVDGARADALRGATFGDRANAAMDAAIKKLDQEYSVKQIEEEKRTRYQRTRERYQASVAEYEELKKQLDAQTGAVTERLESQVETMAQMPLFGVTTVAQFESWDSSGEQYQVALVVTWSKSMERAVRAFITNEDFQVPPGKLSMREWISGQDWTTATGGRRFRDNQGEVYFIGIAASAVGSSSSTERRARGVAEMMAQREVAVALFSDVESHKQASQLMETRSGGAGQDVSIAAEAFASTISQSIQNRQIHGLQQLYGRKNRHPISGSDIYVAIYGISGNGARQALLMQERNYLTRILDEKMQQRLKGTSDAFQEKVEAAIQDTTEYHRSKAVTGAKTDVKADREYRDATQKPTTGVYSPGDGGATKVPGQSQSGVFKGAGSDDIEW